MNQRTFYTIAMAIVIILGLFLNSDAQQTIAVMDFTGKGVSETEASALTDRLRTELVNIGQFKIVEREMMNVILAEQGFQMTGCVSDKCIVAAGQILGVTQMVAGSVSKVGDVYSVSARIVDVETGQISKTATFDHRGNIGDLLIYGMPNIAGALSGEGVEKPHFIKEKSPDTRPDEESDHPPEHSKSLRSGVAVSMNNIWNRGDRPNGWITIDYIKSVNASLFISIGLGWASRIHLNDEYKGSLQELTLVETTNDPTYCIIGRLNYWLTKDKPFVTSAFVGMGLVMFKIHQVARGEDGTFHIFREEGNVFIVIPTGLTIHLLHHKHFRLLIDVGYMFSLSKKRAIGEKDLYLQVYEGVNPAISPSGALTSLRFIWHF